jgi:hypothetical protein
MPSSSDVLIKPFAVQINFRPPLNGHGRDHETSRCLSPCEAS